ncbi:hypothetical protein [Haloprofundus halobius]|uniref:hypothetical protein n=1 Tax=Haloprofundus halobius TaxID=2876194 RepID=UPI001CCD11D0|nr:hypothetical protein [Haloprofundus halobius]
MLGVTNPRPTEPSTLRAVGLVYFATLLVVAVLFQLFAPDWLAVPLFLLVGVVLSLPCLRLFRRVASGDSDE